jgi:hypothetical protein
MVAVIAQIRWLQLLPSGYWPARDPTGNRFLECAERARADFLVAGKGVISRRYGWQMAVVNARELSEWIIAELRRYDRRPVASDQGRSWVSTGQVSVTPFLFKISQDPHIGS